MFWPDGCSAGSFYLQYFYIFLANHSAVGQLHLTRDAEIYCCIQAGGILAPTEVCCAGCTPVCAGRLTCRFFVLLVAFLDFFLTALFQWPRYWSS